MAHALHPAEKERAVELRGKMIDRLLQHALQFFVFHCLIRGRRAFLEIADQVGLIGRNKDFLLQVIADEVKGHRGQKTLKMIDGMKLPALDPQTRKDFLGKVFRLFRILGEFDAKRIDLSGVGSENLPEGPGIAL